MIQAFGLVLHSCLCACSERLVQQIREGLAPLNVKLHLVVLETCPFYASTRYDRQSQARFNKVIAIYEAVDHIFSCAPADVHKASDSFDHDIVDGRELRWILREFGLGIHALHSCVFVCAYRALLPQVVRDVLSLLP